MEDNPTDAELCIRALREHHLANELVWVKDGAEALDFLFREGAYAGRKGGNIEGRSARSSAAEDRRPGGAAPDEGRQSHQVSPGGRAYVLEGGPRRRSKAITSAPTASSASLSASRRSPIPWRNLDCTGWWSTGHRTGVDHGRASRSRNTAVDPRGRPGGCGTGGARLARCRHFLPLAQGRHACRLPGRTGIRSIPI